MRTLAGLLLIAIAVLGGTFFRHYNGIVISYPILWYVGFVVLGLLGVGLIYFASKPVIAAANQLANNEIDKLKASAEKVLPDFDKCEFKNGSFSQWVEDGNMTAVKIFAPGAMASMVDSTVTENALRSYLVYSDVIDGAPVKFMSQSFPFDEITLKYHVLQGNIVLYIDRFDRKKYLFEMNE